MADRDVVFKLKVADHPGNKATLATFAKEAEAVQKQITDATERESKKRIESAKAEATESGKATHKQLGDRALLNREIEQSTAAAQRYNLALQQGSLKSAESLAVLQNRIGDFGIAGRKSVRQVTDAILDINKAVDAVQPAELFVDTTAVIDRTTISVVNYNRSLREGFVKGAEGALMLGRGIAALGLAGEEDIEKLARALVRVQGIVDVAKGGVQIYEAITRSVEAYRAAVLSAAAAESALAAARGRGAVGAAAGGVAARGAGAGIAGAAGAGVAAFPPAAIAAAAVAAVASIGAVAASIFSPKFAEKAEGVVGFDIGALAPIASPLGTAIGLAFSSEFRERMAGAYGIETEASAAAAALERLAAAAEVAKQTAAAAFIVRQGAALDTRVSDVEMRKRQVGMSPLDANWDSLGEAFRNKQTAKRETFRAANAMSSGLLGYEEGLTAIIAARDAEVATAERMLGLTKERESLIKEGKQKELETAQRIESVLQSELDKALAISREAMGRLDSAESRLAGLSPEEARRAQIAASKAAAGEALGRGEANALRGLPGFEDAVKASDRARITSLGLDPLLAGARGDAARAGGAVSAATIAAEAARSTTAALRSEAATIGEEIGIALRNLLEEIKVSLEAKLRAERTLKLDAENRRIREGARAREAAAGG